MIFYFIDTLKLAYVSLISKSFFELKCSEKCYEFKQDDSLYIYYLLSNTDIILIMEINYLCTLPLVEPLIRFSISLMET